MKMLKVAAVLVLAVCLAAPAFAEMKLNGYYRLQGSTLAVDNDGADDETDVITQRLRMKLTNSLNDNVGFVYYGEVDLNWGVDGDVGIDAVNLETKNAYLYINDENFSAILGGQGYNDIFNGLLISEDIMAITANFKLGAADLGLAYGKLAEGSAKAEDDRDFYAATASFSASDAVTIKAGVYVDDKEATTEQFALCATSAGCKDADKAAVAIGDVYTSANPAAEATNVYYGVSADAKASDNLNLSAFGLIADMEGGDTYVLDVSAKLKLANGSLNLEALYAPEEDDAADQFGDVADFFYNGHNLMFLLRDVAATSNATHEGYYRTALDGGAGLTMLLLSGNFDFDAFYAGFGLGYADTDTDELGTEIGLKVGKKFFGNVDVSLRAAQWNAGDTTAYTNDETKVIGMVNVGF